MGNFLRRRDDLAHVLKTSKSVSNKNHDISLHFGLKRPDFKLCANCPRSLECHAGPDNIHVTWKDICGARYTPMPYSLDSGLGIQGPLPRGVLPCWEARATILFSYHGSLCSVFDRVGQRYTDMGMWGHTVTTNRAVRWYIDALRWNNLITAKEEMQILDWCRKKDRKSKNFEDCWILL